MEALPQQSLQRQNIAPPFCATWPQNFIVLPDGSRGMVVVDPMTRKLCIPLVAIFETKAQQRVSIPSLCQLFLHNRCRQGNLCHQVHADCNVINMLREQIQSLPRCCVLHGDSDFTEGREDTRAVYVENMDWNEGIIPVHHLSYTSGLDRVLRCTQPTEVNGKNVFVATGVNGNICRLHVMDRCRFAEDCKFLHVCKNVSLVDQRYADMQYSRPCGGQGYYDAPPPPPPPPFPINSAAPPNCMNLSIDELQSPSLIGRCTPPSPDYGGGSDNGSTIVIATPPSTRKYRQSGDEWTHQPYTPWASFSSTPCISQSFEETGSFCE